MNEAIKMMLKNYDCISASDYENALKEIIQEIALLGLWRSKFFEKACFYGGSALRILYGLDRFSEDLDFSLNKKDKYFSLDAYSKAIEDELRGFGFSVTIVKKEKAQTSNIESAFIKAGTLKNLIVINVEDNILKTIHKGKKLTVKLEVDRDPPLGFQQEAKYLFQPIPFSVNTYSLPFLFAGKMHAILCRPWVNRVKGRDWYDLIWYIGKNISMNIEHLENRMKKSGHLKPKEVLTKDLFKKIFLKKVETIDFKEALKDIKPLLKDTDSLRLWSKDYFKTVFNNISIDED
ncbi:MAG: nucleotidyl transferase AbiEii/AbiGii toxin family protein [Alphaproteobacteria bacterium]